MQDGTEPARDPGPIQKPKQHKRTYLAIKGSGNFFSSEVFVHLVFCMSAALHLRFVLGDLVHQPVRGDIAGVERHDHDDVKADVFTSSAAYR